MTRFSFLPTAIDHLLAKIKASIHEKYSMTYDNLIRSLQFADKLASLGLPDTDLAVHGPAGDVGAVDAEGNLGDRVGVAAKLVQLLAVVQTPEITLVVAAAGHGNVLVDGVEGHIVDGFWGR